MGGDCPGALARLQEYLDGELPEVTVVEIDEHVGSCHGCGERVTFARQLRTVVRVCVSDETAPEGLLQRVREACWGDCAE